MDKLKYEVTDNRFIPRAHEELTVLEIIDKITKYVNNVILDIDNKTDLHGDHKGTWQGLNKPTLSVEGAFAQVEKNMADISLLKTDVNKIKSLTENVVDVKLLEGYDQDDISKVFNSIEYVKGYTYILDTQECNCRHMIDITLPEHTTLIIKSFVNCYDSFMRLRVGQGCRVELDYIKAVNENVYDRGLHLVKGSDSIINIGKIQGFLTSVAYRPLEAWDWIQFMKLNFFDISGDVGLELAVPNENCWVNENTFNGGGFGGRINIWLHKIFDDKNFRSLINNNKFYNIALQSKEECILIEKSSGETNYFYNLRTWEQDEYHQGELYINDNGGSNYFECLHAIQYDKIKLGGDSKFDGQLFAPWDVSTDSFPLVCYSAIGDRDKTKPIIKTPILTDVDCNRSKGYFYLNTVTKKVVANMGNGEQFTVFLSKPLFFRNNNLYFRKAGYNNNTIVKLETPTGKSINLVDNGLYLVSLSDSYDYFEVVKIADGEPITPQ